jgi:hypothetical protein
MRENGAIPAWWQPRSAPVFAETSRERLFRLVDPNTEYPNCEGAIERNRTGPTRAGK